MPSRNLKQHDFMAICANNPAKARGKCPPHKVAHEFILADTGKHFSKPVKVHRVK